MMSRNSFLIVAAILLVSATQGCSSQGDDEVYLLPSDFTGVFVVLYDIPDGAVAEFTEDGDRIYRIPQSGILRTQFSKDYGYMRVPRFYYSTLDSEKSIPVEAIDSVHLSDTAIAVKLPSTGKMYPDNGSMAVITYSVGAVGAKEEIASLDFGKINIADFVGN